MGEICLGIGASHSPILFVKPEKCLARIHKDGVAAGEPDSFKLTPENVAKTRAQKLDRAKRCFWHTKGNAARL